MKYTQLYEPGWLQARFDAGQLLRSIAAEVGCDRTTVRKAARRLRLQSAGTAKFPPLGDRAWLTARYVTAGRSVASIADELGADSATVTRALDRASIARRPTRRDRPPAARLRREWRRSESVSAIARAHGVSWALAELWLAEAGIFTRARPRIPRRQLRRYVRAGEDLAALSRRYGMDPRKLRIELLRHGLEPALSTAASGQRGRFRSG